MGLELAMVGLTVRDLAASLDFYRRLGLAIPEVAPEQQHVPVRMQGGLTFFLDTRAVARTLPDAQGEVRPYQVLLEFFMPDRAAVDAKYTEMTGLGYRGYREPHTTAIGMYFALLDDPDGNTILLSSPLGSPSAARPGDMPRRWRRQRHGLGLLLVLCSLLVGCFIPICLGLFAGASGLGALVTLLAGVAGVLLLLGAMLLLAAEGQTLTAPEPAASAGPAAELLLPLREPPATEIAEVLGQAGDSDRSDELTAPPGSATG